MIKDNIRTDTYKDAILRNTHLFEGKVVMDVGCGTGILSIFAVRAGARHVIAVDCSDIAIWAKRIIKENRMEDKITVVKQKMEEITELPNGIKQVDVIVSEWMG